MNNLLNSPIIIDSSGIISLLIDTDTNHKKALHIIENYNFNITHIIVPSDVFSESVNILGKKLGHSIAYNFANHIFSDTIFKITSLDTVTIENALNLFHRLPNSVSYTDCCVMALADTLDSKLVFGFDTVFKKMATDCLNKRSHLGSD